MKNALRNWQQENLLNVIAMADVSDDEGLKNDKWVCSRAQVLALDAPLWEKRKEREVIQVQI